MPESLHACFESLPRGWTFNSLQMCWGSGTWQLAWQLSLYTLHSTGKFLLDTLESWHPSTQSPTKIHSEYFVTWIFKRFVNEPNWGTGRKCSAVGPGALVFPAFCNCPSLSSKVHICWDTYPRGGKPCHVMSCHDMLNSTAAQGILQSPVNKSTKYCRI